MYLFDHTAVGSMSTVHFKFKCDECRKEVEGDNNFARPYLIIIKADDPSLDGHFCSEACQEKYGQKHYNWLPRF